ncbi:TniB family NTP-binding protein [Duganella qianjiadongensis]|uniref:AAA family ATPase n=1 Tax=Duganella qianjiadongensis TaxID=2692176 RepID=A0ABW9VRY1_9BURK|nr:TniB family NTP-binding protein [Duganella qianjiadongensis]MYM41910.1 AAA family ATPase [Duganella qianjiadongensis]
MNTAQQLRKDIEACEIPHLFFDTLLTALEQRIEDTLAGFAPKIERISGPSGVGKSSIVASLARKYPESRIEGRRYIPVLIVRVPQAATPKLLPKSVLAALGIKVAASPTAGTMFDLMVEQLRLAGTRVIVFDETSHLVDEGSRVPPRAASDWLKELADKLDITLILLGIPRIEKLFSANEQLPRRARPVRYFRPYDPRDEMQMAAYASCVASYGEMFATAGYPISVPSQILTEQSFLLSGGLIGVLADFVRELARLLNNVAPRPVTYLDCVRAVEEVSHAGSPHQLAFQNSAENNADVEPAALTQAYAHVLSRNTMPVTIRKNGGIQQ